MYVTFSLLLSFCIKLFRFKVNIYDFFKAHELGKASVFLLRENVEPELHDAAQFVILGVIMDMIESVIPR